jgi:organic hydroperoxide reductase OsmC/OhrA
MKTHKYQSNLIWTGQNGKGTTDYRSYDRSYEISIAGKPTFKGSADPSFRGDPAFHNPEELLLMALSSCHMLWYLHLCADAGVVVVDYQDKAQGTMIEESDGSGRFSEVTLRPEVVISESGDKKLALKLHEQAGRMCFIANSCNFPVRHSPVVLKAI